MTIFDATPALQQLLTAYFHEDWTMDRRTFAEIVRDFAMVESRDVVLAATSEARALLARPITDEMLEAGLSDVGCSFYAPTAGLTARDWLSNVADMLEATG
jgi:hypothetical protein